MKPLSLYIHIPFCYKKCLYCDFLSFDGKEDFIEGYVETLIKEIRAHGVGAKDRRVISVFVGGGTPSILPANEIKSIMSEIYESFEVAEDAEITIECNPGTLTKERIEAYKASGINRISMGLQSTDESKLQELGRIHSFEVFKKNYQALRDAGFGNINVDLMFGLSGQSIEDWDKTLKEVVVLEPEHISTYGLIIEEETPFFEQYESDLLDLPDEDGERKMYWLTHEILEKNGYTHYEISNYSKKGFECVHNKVYWELGDYIGIGLGAASFCQGYRLDNTRLLNNYLTSNGDPSQMIVSSHYVTRQEEKEEFIFLGLRLLKGISKERYQVLFGSTIDEDYSAIILRMIQEGLIIEDGDILKLSSRGIDVSNYVFAQFLHEA